MFTKLDLRQFYGTEGYYRINNLVVYTDGINFLIEKGCRWIITEIALAQYTHNLQDHPFQSWILTYKDSVADIRCDDGNGNSLFHIILVNAPAFPLPEITIFVERGSIDGKTEVMVMMLPSER